MPTFGETADGGSSGIMCGSGYVDRLRGSWFTCPVTCKAQSISVLLVAASTRDLTAKCGIYKRSDSSFVAGTQEAVYEITTTPTWKTYTFATEQDLSNLDYWLVCWGDGEALALVYMRYVADVSGKGRIMALNYPDDWPATFTGTDFTSKNSIYCTYSAGIEYEKTLTEALGLLDASIRRDTGKVLPEILGLVDPSIIKGVEVTKTELLGLLDVDIRKDVEITKSEILGLLDVLDTAYGKGYSVTLTEILGLSDVLIKATGIQLTEILGLVDTLIKLRLRDPTRILAAERILDPFRILPPERVQGPG